MSKIKEFYHDEISQGLHFASDDSDYAYEAWRAHKESIAHRAEKLGILAWREGAVRTPYWDPALRALLDETGWHWTAKASEAWLRGWDHEQTIGLEIEESTRAQIESWELEEADREHPRWAYGL